MPKYAIKAPDGNMYQIDGPVGATDEQVRAEVLKQHPNAGGTVPTPEAPKEQPTVMSEIGRAAWNTPRSILDMGVGMVKGSVDDVLHPIETSKRVWSMLGKGVDITKGAFQAVRELTPVDQQGTAPALDKTAFNDFKGNISAKYGTPRRALTTVANDPANVVLMAASMAVPALRVVGADRALAAAGTKVVGGMSKAVRPVTEHLTAGRRSAAMSATQAESTKAGYASEGLSGVDTQIQNAEKVARLRRRAAQADEAGYAKIAQKRRAEADAIASAPDIAEPVGLTERGLSVRDPAKATLKDKEAELRATDTEHRAAMDAISTERSAKGEGVSDETLAQEMVARSKALVKPDLKTRPTVGFEPRADAGGKLHEEIIDTLSPRHYPITKAEVPAYEANGAKVEYNAKGDPHVVVKPSLGDVDVLRRKLGQVANGEPHDYGAISQIEAGKLKAQVQAVMDAYSDGASTTVRDNYRTHKQGMEAFEKLKSGKTVLGLQKGTKEFSVPASQIPDRLIDGGRETLQHAAAIAGEDPVKGIVRSHVQDVLSNSPNAEAMRKAVAPGTTTHDAMQFDPTLEGAVQEVIAKREAAQAAGAKVPVLEKGADRFASHAERYRAAANALDGTTIKSAERVREITGELNKLSIADPAEISTRYTKMLDEQFKRGEISSGEHMRGLELARDAKKAFKQKDTRDRWIKNAVVISGGVTAGIGTGLGVAGAVGGLAAGTGVRALSGKFRGRH